MFHTISQHFTWPSLCTQVKNFVKHSNTCQHYKTQRKKYGHVPVPDKQQNANPWHSIAVDTIGPWIIPQFQHNNLQVNAEKSSFCALETQYLGFILTREGIKPQQQKVNAILQVTPPRNVKQVRSFVGMLNHYKAMIPRCSHHLALLTALTKKKVKFEWTKERQQAFNSLKNSLAREVVIAYPDFSVPFEIYTDASKYQIRSVITQKDKPLAFYSRKLTDPQTRYTVTELKLLAIVETLREYKCILLGHLITIYMDHKNLTFSNFTTDCVTCWQLRVEEYGPKIVYLPGKRNIIADAISRLPKLKDPYDESTFLEEIKHCNTCQHYKTQRKKYGHVPVLDKQHNANPWHSIAVDTIGPWIILQSPHSSKSKESMTLQALTIIDLNTHLMEIVALKNKESITVARSLDQVWLCRYPRSVDCLHDNGTEFVSTKFQELLQSYGIRSKLTTVKNPQANGILERTHQIIGNLLRSSRLIAQDLDTISANKNFSCQLCGPSTQHSIQP
jgi:hypothetical protein